MATPTGPQTDARKIYICNAEDDEVPARLLADYLRSEGCDVY